MSQRNPMNQRYQRDDHTGVTRKSAASAKPKTKAAASVTMSSSKKTPAEKKAAQKAARKKEQQRQRELDAKYYKPDTERYKKLRRTWWLALIGTIVCVCCSWLLRGVQPEWLAMVCLFAAYALIIFAFYLDFSKIRKERRAYQDRMVAMEAEQEKAARKAGKHGQGAADEPAADAAPAAVQSSATTDAPAAAQSSADAAPKRTLFRRKKASADAAGSEDGVGETATEKA